MRKAHLEFPHRAGARPLHILQAGPAIPVLKFPNFVQDCFSIAPEGCFGNNSGVQLFKRPSKPLPDSAPEREDKIRFASDEVVRKAARRVFTKYKLTMRKLAE